MLCALPCLQGLVPGFEYFILPLQLMYTMFCASLYVVGTLTGLEKGQERLQERVERMEDRQERLLEELRDIKRLLPQSSSNARWP